MNLASDPWIPVVMRNGEPREVSIKDAFLRGDEIADLSVRPHERIALMRLFLCVAHAALDGGPLDEDDWQSVQDRLPSAVEKYLCKDNVHVAFSLFGDGNRFLQVSGLTRDTVQMIDELDLCLATGNNSTLFDNAGGSTRLLSTSQIALSLVAFQSFALMKPIGVATWSGEQTRRNGAKRHGICLHQSPLHAYLLGPTLLDTIWLNLPSRDLLTEHRGEHATMGRPLWEQMPSSLQDDQAIANATRSYMGRLLPMSRMIRIQDDRHYVMGYSFDYSSFPEFAKEPETTSLVVREARSSGLLKASTDKAIWRSLHAVTVLAQRGNGGPLALHHLHRLNTTEFTLWVGGLCARADASIEDVVESVYPLDVLMLEPTGRGAYEGGVNMAEQIAAKALYAAIKEYAKHMKAQKGFVADASCMYWTALEQGVRELFSVIRERTKYMENGEIAWDHADNPWGRRIAMAAENAYSFACPRATSHQLEAYAVGLVILRKKIKSVLQGKHSHLSKRMKPVPERAST